MMLFAPCFDCLKILIAAAPVFCFAQTIFRMHIKYRIRNGTKASMGKQNLRTVREFFLPFAVFTEVIPVAVAAGIVIVIVIIVVVRKKRKKRQRLNEEEELLDELDRSSEDER